MIKIKRAHGISESKQCEYFHELLFIKRIWHHHSPNGELRNKITGSKLKRMRTSSGFPDYFIPYPRKGYHGLYIELKTEKGKLSDSQKEWLKFLNDQNYLGVVCIGWIEASKVVENYFE